MEKRHTLHYMYDIARDQGVGKDDGLMNVRLNHLPKSIPDLKRKIKMNHWNDIQASKSPQKQTQSPKCSLNAKAIQPDQRIAEACSSSLRDY